MTALLWLLVALEGGLAAWASRRVQVAAWGGVPLYVATTALASFVWLLIVRRETGALTRASLLYEGAYHLAYLTVLFSFGDRLTIQQVAGAVFILTGLTLLH